MRLIETFGSLNGKEAVSCMYDSHPSSIAMTVDRLWEEVKYGPDTYFPQKRSSSWAYVLSNNYDS